MIEDGRGPQLRPESAEIFYFAKYLIEDGRIEEGRHYCCVKQHFTLTLLMEEGLLPLIMYSLLSVPMARCNSRPPYIVV